MGWKKSELESFEGKEMVVEGTQVVAKNYYDVMALVLRGNFLPYYVIILIAVYFSFFLFFPVPFEISAVQLVWNVYVAHTTGLMSTGTATLLNKTKAVKDVHLFFFFFGHHHWFSSSWSASSLPLILSVQISHCKRKPRCTSGNCSQGLLPIPKTVLVRPHQVCLPSFHIVL